MTARVAKNRKRVVPASAAVFSIIASAIGSTFAEPQDVPPITVSASPLVAEETVTAYGGSVSVVTREQMDNAGATDLQSALRRVSGVTASRYTLLGAFGGADGGSIFIRGRGTGRPGSDIRIYQDGVPRKVGVFDHPLLDTLAVDHAERISVYKGPQPAVHGGAFGAADIESRRRSLPGLETEAEVTAGEHRTLTGRLHHGGREEGLDYYGGVSYKETDGHRPHSAVELQSLYGRVGAALGSGFTLSAQVTATDNKVEDPGIHGEPVPARDQFATKTVTPSVRLDNKGEKTDGFALLYYEDGQIRWDKDRIGAPGTPAGASDTDWENYGMRAAQTFHVDRVSLQVGLDASSEGGSTENRTVSGMVPFAFKDRYETVAPGAAADVQWEAIPCWTVQPSVGVRHYMHSDFSDETAPHAGVAVRGAGWTIFGNAARGVNYPGVYASGIAASTLDELEAETLDHVEVGAQWRSPKETAMIGVSLFRDRTDNLLQWTPAGLLNVGSADVDGVEITTHLRPFDRLALYAGITLLDPDDPKTPRVPGWTASAGATLAVTRKLQLHADVDAVAEQYTFNGRAGGGERATAEKVDRYAVGNLRIAFSPVLADKGRITLFAGCDNIADASYETLAGYPLPGRFYNGGISAAF